MYDQHYSWLRRQHLKQSSVAAMEEIAQSAAQSLPKQCLENLDYFRSTDVQIIDKIPFPNTVPADKIRYMLKTDESFLSLFLFYIAQETDEIDPF